MSISGASVDKFLQTADDYDKSLFVKFAISEIVNRIDDAKRNITSNIESGKLRIYRAMLVGEDYLNHLISQGKHLGIFWTLDKDLADVYNSSGYVSHKTDVNNSSTVVIETEISEDYIDWEQTLLARIDIDYGDKEEEITLFKGTPIKILYLYDKDSGEDFDISAIKNKTFYA